MKSVLVASTNPAKINAVKIGFEKMFPGELFEYEGVSVDSGVSAQPMSEEETMLGARNRVDAIKKLKPDADYFVGIEGGIEMVNNEMKEIAWVVIHDHDDHEGKGTTNSFFLPKVLVRLIQEGKELGEANDIVFGTQNSKQKNGAIGILTGDVITRTELCASAVVCALIPFKNQPLYFL